MVDISMNVAKAVMSGVVIGVLVTGVLAISSVPVVFTTLGIIIVGLFFNYALNYLDDKIELSASLKNKLRDYLHHSKHENYVFNSHYFYSF
ncbi:hypothetical protein [Salmonella enterica]|nr:hypothetical protein [Salmonella enterica]